MFGVILLCIPHFSWIFVLNCAPIFPL
jgi:hypothetical protein